MIGYLNISYLQYDRKLYFDKEATVTHISWKRGYVYILLLAETKIDTVFVLLYVDFRENLTELAVL